MSQPETIVYSPENIRFDTIDSYFETSDLDENESNLDIVREYFKQISTIPVPSSTEVRQLAEAIQRGKRAEESLRTFRFDNVQADIVQIKADAAAGETSKERLVTGHLRFAAYIARLTMGWIPFGSNGFKSTGESVFKGAIIKNLSRLASSPMPLADRLQLANEGLMKAADKYKPDLGAKFTTYASYDIENEIMRAIDYDRNVKVPINILGSLARTAIHPTEITESTFPSIDGVYPSQSRRYVEEISRTLSIEELEEQSSQLIDDDELAPSFYETIPDKHIDVAELAIENIKSEAIRRAVKTLPARERKILALRFGFYGDQLTLEAIGAEIGVTRERVRQLERQALRSLSYGIALARIASE